MATVLAAAAFVVALLTLYLSNIRRADIEVVQLPRQIHTKNSTRREEGGLMKRADVVISLAAMNSGARPGLISGITVDRDSQRYAKIESASPNPNFRDGELGALPLLAGETRVFNLEVGTSFPEEAVVAWSSGSFSGFDVVIRYTFLRGTRIRKIATRKLKVTVPVDAVVS